MSPTPFQLYPSQPHAIFQPSAQTAALNIVALKHLSEILNMQLYRNTRGVVLARVAGNTSLKSTLFTIPVFERLFTTTLHISQLNNFKTVSGNTKFPGHTCSCRKCSFRSHGIHFVCRSGSVPSWPPTDGSPGTLRIYVPMLQMGQPDIELAVQCYRRCNTQSVWLK